MSKTPKQDKPEKHPGGRPTDYTDEVASRICAQIADGQNLHALCQQEDMPSRSTVYRWFDAKKEFWDKYTRAREIRGDWRADQVDDIALQLKSGKIDAGQARVLFDMIRWQTGKENPRAYSDKVSLEHSGPDGGPIETVSVPPSERLKAYLDGVAKRSGTDSEPA